MKGTSYRKKPLPKVIQSTKPSGTFIRSILDDETFDCLKKEILENSAGRIGKTVQAIERKRQLKADKARRREEVRDQLIKQYGDDLFTRFKSKRKRKAFAHGRLTSEQVGVLRYYTNRFKEREKTKRRRAERRSKGHRTSYETYINSKDWERRRNAFWQTHPRRCAVCDTGLRIHLHHMSYRKIGAEPDEHLIPLCQAHHRRYHELNGSQRDMIQATMAFIQQERLTSTIH